jgi:hypothetical protein
VDTWTRGQGGPFYRRVQGKAGHLVGLGTRERRGAGGCMCVSTTGAEVLACGTSGCMVQTWSRWPIRTRLALRGGSGAVVPGEVGSHQSPTFTCVHQGPVSKYHTHAYTKHNQ